MPSLPPTPAASVSITRQGLPASCCIFRPKQRHSIADADELRCGELPADVCVLEHVRWKLCQHHTRAVTIQGHIDKFFQYLGSFMLCRWPL